MKRKIPLLLLCILFLSIAGHFGIRMYQKWSEYRTGEKTYEELARYVRLETSPHLEEKSAEQEPDSSTPLAMPLPETGVSTEQEPVSSIIPDTPSVETGLSSEPDTTNWPTVDFEALQAINPDVVAWIFIEGTKINYPVVQGTDNSYYLNRLFDGNYNSAGSIFMDYRNESDLSDKHSVFYGHYMRNGSMFNQITKYKDQTFYDEHPVCLIMTPHGNYKLEFFAGYVTDLNSQSWKLEFASNEEYALWLKDAISKSTFSSSVKPTEQDRVVTFSTCTYEYDDARYVLVGVLNKASE